MMRGPPPPPNWRAWALSVKEVLWMEPSFSNKITETDGKICLQNRLLEILQNMSYPVYN